MSEERTPADEPDKEGGIGPGSTTTSDDLPANAEARDADVQGSQLEEGASTPEPEAGSRHGSAPEEGAAAGVGAAEGGATPSPQPPAGAPNWDRIVIIVQILAGIALVVFGALLAALTKSSTHDIGTAVIGIGAALLPAGAAASASARISNTNSDSGR